MEWILVLFIALIIAVKRESDANKKLQNIQNRIDEEVYQENQHDLENLENESAVLEEHINELKTKWESTDKKTQQLTKELEFKMVTITEINESISALKLEIIKFTNMIKIEQQKYEKCQLSSESMERLADSEISEIEDITMQMNELETEISEKLAQNKVLKVQYDEAVFKVLQSKAKKVQMLEQLQMEEHLNDQLNASIKENQLKLKTINEHYLPQLQELSQGFENNWDSVIKKLDHDIDYLNRDQLLRKYEDLHILNADAVEEKHRIKLETVAKTFKPFEKQIRVETQNLATACDHTLVEIQADYQSLAQKFYVIVGQWLSESNDSPKKITMVSSPTSSTVVAASPVISPELSKILRANLFSDLNIRHLASIINDSSFDSERGQNTPETEVRLSVSSKSSTVSDSDQNKLQILQFQQKPVNTGIPLAIPKSGKV